MADAVLFSKSLHFYKMMKAKCHIIDSCNFPQLLYQSVCWELETWPLFPSLQAGRRNGISLASVGVSLGDGLSCVPMAVCSVSAGALLSGAGVILSAIAQLVV